MSAAEQRENLKILAPIFFLAEKESEQNEEQIIMDHLETTFAALIVRPECRMDIISEKAGKKKCRDKDRNGPHERLFEQLFQTVSASPVPGLKRPPKGTRRQEKVRRQSGKTNPCRR